MFDCFLDVSQASDHSYQSQLIHLVGGEETTPAAPNRLVMQWYQTDNEPTREIPSECHYASLHLWQPHPLFATRYSGLFAAQICINVA